DTLSRSHIVVGLVKWEVFAAERFPVQVLEVQFFSGICGIGSAAHGVPRCGNTNRKQRSRPRPHGKTSPSTIATQDRANSLLPRCYPQRKKPRCRGFYRLDLINEPCGI